MLLTSTTRLSRAVMHRTFTIRSRSTSVSEYTLPVQRSRRLDCPVASLPHPEQVLGEASPFCNDANQVSCRTLFTMAGHIDRVDDCPTSMGT